MALEEGQDHIGVADQLHRPKHMIGRYAGPVFDHIAEFAVPGMAGRACLGQYVAEPLQQIDAVGAISRSRVGYDGDPGPHTPLLLPLHLQWLRAE